MLINGRYQLHEKLGQGGMGIVHRATDRLTGEIVALKQVFLPVEQIMFSSRPISQTNRELRLALAHEFQTLAGLRHPNIISVLDYGFDEKRQPFFTMSYLENAQTILAAGNGRSVPEKVNLLIRMLEALAYLHRRSILHRDLKPDNVLVVGDKVRVLDFGLAAFKEQATESVGSWLYMAPEVLLGQPASEASDLYTVGVLAYRLLAGTHPFNIYAEDTIGEILEGEPDWQKMGVGEALTAVIRTLLAKKAADRYPTANETIVAFYRALGQPVPEETAVIRESYLQAATFIGRKAEMSQLQEALAQANAGQGSAWLIGGESGAGKTRLVNELRIQALVAGFQVWRGQAIAEGGGSFQVWRDLAGYLALHTELSDLEAGVLKELEPNLPQILQREIATAPELNGRDAQQRLIFTLVDLLHRQTQPVLLLLEDLHWAEESLEPIKRLTALLSEEKLLLIGTYRSDERPTLPEELGDSVHTLTLSRFDNNHVGQLAEAMLGEAGQQPEIVAQLQTETEGNIFFLVEILRAWAEEAGGLLQVGQVALPEHILTGGIQQVVQRRLDKVPAIYQPLLKLAAVVGRKLDLAVLAHIAPAVSLEAWLLACNEAMVLEVQENVWQFAHDKLRENILIQLDANTRPDLHRQVAQALETLYPDQEDLNEILLKHWQQAGEIDKEIHYLTLVVQMLSEIGKHAYIQELTERGLHLLPADDKRTIELLLLQASDLAWQGHFPQAQALAQQAQDLAVGFNNQAQLARSLNILGEIALYTGHHEQALGNYQEALALNQRIDNKKGITVSFHGLGFVAGGQGKHGQALSYFQQSLRHSQEIGETKEQAVLLMNLGVSTKALGHYEEAIAYYQQSLAITQASGALDLTAFTLANLGTLVAIQGNYAQAYDYLQQSLTIREKIGAPLGIAISLDCFGTALYYEGNYEAAIDYFQRSLDIFQRIGFQRGVGIVLKNLGFTYLHLGDARAIETFCTVLISAHGVHDVLLETIVGFAWLRYQQDQIASAAELVGLVRHHPAYNQDLQHRLDGLLPRLEATLNLDKLSTAMERGKNLDLDRVVQDLLREFGEEATAVLPGQNNKESDD